MSALLIYGATGYTGSMVARQAKLAGLDFTIAGRDPDRLAALADELDVPFRAFGLDDSTAVDQHLEDFAVVLNCAGPFARTAEPLMRAAIGSGTHYLDITAEINVYRLAEQLHEQAVAANVLLLPGVGWDVVPTDCLAVHVAGRVEAPVSLRIALQVAGPMSRGSAISAGEIIGVGLMARVAGKLVPTPDAKTAAFDFGNGPVDCAPLAFGDLVTAWRSTGVPDIAMFVNVTGGSFPGGDLSKLPAGPTLEEREGQRARAVAEITGADGSVARSVIETVNGYTYTPLSAVEAARRVLGGEMQAGFDTPARLFRVEFAQTIPGTTLLDL